MTPQEFHDEMLKCDAIEDTEEAHAAADKLMMRLLRELGYGAGIDVFEDMERWYA